VLSHRSRLPLSGAHHDSNRRADDEQAIVPAAQQEKSHVGSFRYFGSIPDPNDVRRAAELRNAGTRVVILADVLQL
jgi:hypothetical protein